MTARRCTCAGTAPGYPQHESWCGKPEPAEDARAFRFEVTPDPYKGTSYFRDIDSALDMVRQEIEAGHGVTVEVTR